MSAEVIDAVSEQAMGDAAAGVQGNHAGVMYSNDYDSGGGDQVHRINDQGGTVISMQAGMNVGMDAVDTGQYGNMHSGLKYDAYAPIMMKEMGEHFQFIYHPQHLVLTLHLNHEYVMN